MDFASRNEKLRTKIKKKTDSVAGYHNKIFWRLINRQKGKHTNLCSEIEANGEILTNSIDISAAFAPSENENFEEFKKSTETQLSRMYDSAYNCNGRLTNLTLTVQQFKEKKPH